MRPMLALSCALLSVAMVKHRNDHARLRRAQRALGDPMRWSDRAALNPAGVSSSVGPLQPTDAPLASSDHACSGQAA